MTTSSSPGTTRARTGRFSLATFQTEPLVGRWLKTHACVGVFCGALLSLIHQLTQARFGDGSASLTERALAVLLTSVGYAALMLVAAAIAGWLCVVRGSWRRLAVSFGAAALWLASCAHLLAEAVYVTAGSPMTVGALEFFANGWQHMLRALLHGYWQVLSLFALGTVVLVVLVALVLSRATHDPVLSGRRLLVGLLIGIGVLLGLNELVARDRGGWALVWASTPELAFLESIHLQAKERESLESDKSLRPDAGNELSAGRLWAGAAHESDQRGPNVLFIMLESVGANHLGFAGYQRGVDEPSVTPNIDRIAEKSLWLRRAWTTATHSNYAQMAALSSLFPRRTSGLDTYKRLDYPRVLLHDFLYALSYRTATISSQDETWQGMLRFQTTATPTLRFHARDHQGPLINTGTERIVPDHLTAERVRRLILAQQREPWGVYVNFQMTHFPYKLPPGVSGPFEPATPNPKTFRYLSYPKADLEKVLNKYDNALHYVDQAVGRLYDALIESHQLDRTIVVLTSDHGELFHEHGLVTHGRTLYDAEARVPLLVHFPRALEPGVSDAPVSHLDILPTLADLLEVAPHPSFQGQSFADPGSIDARQKAVFLNIQGMRTAEAIVCWPYKLIKERERRHPELYNLERDPGETDNLYYRDSRPAQRLQRLLRAQMRAQLEYHHPDNAELREERFAPRLLTCDAPLD